MNCATHPELPAIAYCRTCGRALCESCERVFENVVYCAEHVPAAAAGAGPGPAAGAAPEANYSPYTAPIPPAAGITPERDVSPGLAFILGLIPGVGAIYNSQYVKGIIHVVILGVLIGILDSGQAGYFEPLFGILTATFFFYMAFEAYHTAKRRQLGLPVDEFSSIIPLRAERSRVPVGPIVLIAVGILFLLNTLGWLRFADLIRYWPVALIVLGFYMLYERLTSPAPEQMGGGSPQQEMSHERR